MPPCKRTGCEVPANKSGLCVYHEQEAKRHASDNQKQIAMVKKFLADQVPEITTPETWVAQNDPAERID